MSIPLHKLLVLLHMQKYFEETSMISHMSNRCNSIKNPVTMWEKQLFALDHQFFLSNSSNVASKQSPSPKSPKGNESPEKELKGTEGYRIPISEIMCAVRCVELSLPEGEAFWLQTNSFPQVLSL